MEALEDYYVEELGSYTTDDIEALPEDKRAELINGYIYMMGTPNRIHQDLVGELHAEIRNHIRSKGGACRSYVSPFAVYLDGKKTKKQWAEPDVFVVCDKDKIHDDGIYGAPDWIIEVISRSTAEKDMTVKLTAYRNHGVKEYWIVNPMSRKTYVYIFSPEYSMTDYTFDDEISPSLYPDLKLKLTDLLP